MFTFKRVGIVIYYCTSVLTTCSTNLIFPSESCSSSFFRSIIYMYIPSIDNNNGCQAPELNPDP